MPNATTQHALVRDQVVHVLEVSRLSDKWNLLASPEPTHWGVTSGHIEKGIQRSGGGLRYSLTVRVGKEERKRAE